MKIRILNGKLDARTRTLERVREIKGGRKGEEREQNSRLSLFTGIGNGRRKEGRKRKAARKKKRIEKVSTTSANSLLF